MNKRTFALALALAATLVLAPSGTAFGQTIGQNQNIGLWLPNVSSGATIGQTVGMTDISIVYHRPAVNERTVFGGLVPYGQVWRTGANENTVIELSTDVTVEGEKLPAGTYGLHTIPGESEWTVIFSNDATAWGSFSYAEENDALRVTVKPAAADHEEQMSFSFDDVTSDSATITFRWADVAVPIKVVTATNELVYANIQKQLKGIAQFSWNGPNQAASWCLTNDVHLEEALQWADGSIQAEQRFENLSTKAQLLGKLGRDEESDEVMTLAIETANPSQMHGYGRQLLAKGQHEKAVEIFQLNADRNPDVWFMGVGLARGLSAQGELEKAAVAMRDALAKAPDSQKAYIQGLVDQLDKGQSI